FSKTNLFSGIVTARGGAGANYGGAGTFYSNTNNGPINGGQLVMNNGGNRGAVTPLPLDNGFANSPDLSVLGGSIVSNGLTSVRNLTVGSNSSLSISPTGLQAQQTLGVQSNVTVQAGGAISVDGTSLNSGGQTLNQTGGGGGYGGAGGASISNALGG